MFDSLDERIKHDAAVSKSRRERITQAIAIAVLSVALFGGLYFAIRMIE